MQSLLMTDSNTEIPYRILEESNVPFVQMPYTLNDVEYYYDLGKNIDLKDFFTAMRAGAMPITSTLPPQHYLDFWQPYLEQGRDIFFICFSSKLSSAFNLIQQARETALQHYPERKITLVDTRSISISAGLLVYYAIDMRNAGRTDEQIEAALLDMRDRMQMFFTVSDLTHLKRGGRLSSGAAMVGSILDIKPTLYITKEGTLVPIDKIKGRKKAMRSIVDRLVETVREPENQICGVIHGDCLEDAMLLRDMIAERLNFKEFWVQMMGPVIGTHGGPDLLAACGLGVEKLL